MAKARIRGTDDLLSRAINLSVGVVDPGLGSGFGVNINSTDEEIAAAADLFRQACQRRVGSCRRERPPCINAKWVDAEASSRRKL